MLSLRTLTQGADGGWEVQAARFYYDLFILRVKSCFQCFWLLSLLINFRALCRLFVTFSNKHALERNDHFFLSSPALLLVSHYPVLDCLSLDVHVVPLGFFITSLCNRYMLGPCRTIRTTDMSLKTSDTRPTLDF